MEKKKVVLGLSGGVDSSVAAYILKKQGYKVIGVFLKNYSGTKDNLSMECLWIKERAMAQKIASELEIPLITLDYEKDYIKKIVSKIYSDYSFGLTPNPDIACNNLIKFPALLDYAKKIKADFIATGHYARIKKIKNNYLLLSGKDKRKDQSYFLYALTQKDLSHTLFPIGNLKKEEVRQIAKKQKFPNWNKKGTRGICFVGKVDMKKFLKKKIKEKRGQLISESREVIGTHPGNKYFTIGERIGEAKGFELYPETRKKYNEKLYVAEKLKGNKLLVVPKNHFLLEKKKIRIHKMHFINPKDKIRKNLSARIRHLGDKYPGRLLKRANNYFFNFKKPVKAIAEGQSIVIYDKEIVIGGGEIRLN